MCRSSFAPLVVALAAMLAPAEAHAHGGLLLSDPAAGATVGATPTAIRLTFSEEPEPSLSTIRVLDSDGGAVQLGGPLPAPGDTRSLVVRVKHLDRGVYTVSWRVVSAVDAHATAGVYAFGVRASPTGNVVVAGATTSRGSSVELTARWLMILGLVTIVGAAAASVGRFGGPRDVMLGWVGLFLTVAGLVLLAVAQYRTAGVSVGELLETTVGRALFWRSLAVAAAGCALIVAARSPSLRRAAMADAGLAAAAAIALHVSAGHAAAGRSAPVVNVVAQSTHFVAVGIWLGGLAALLLGVRGAASDEKAAAVRRFSWVAVGGLLVVVGTGVLRAVAELSTWGELTSTGYGRAVLAKVALLTLVAGLGGVNRLLSVRTAGSDLRPLRRTSTVELGLAAGAMAVAALLGTLAPPAAGRTEPLGLTVSGADYGTTVRARLTTASAEPGPNRFELLALDYDTEQPVSADDVTLRFTPLDDPDVAPTTLRLAAIDSGTYAGSGSHLAFDGRWRVTTVIERGGGSVTIPLELEARSPPRFVAAFRPPGRPPSYTVDVGQEGFIRVSPHPERAGRSRLFVTFYNLLQNERSVDWVAVTAGNDDDPVRRLAVRRLSPSRFVADVVLAEGRNRIAVVERPSEGSRVRATFDLDVP